MQQTIKHDEDYIDVVLAVIDKLSTLEIVLVIAIVLMAIVVIKRS